MDDIDDQQSAQSSDDLLQQFQNDLAQIKEEAQMNLNGWKRAQADFENYKKRKEAENQELIEFAREVVVARLLPTLDSLEQAFKHIPPTDAPDFADKFNNWKTGAEGILKQLDKSFAEMGVKKIEALGKKFDPHFHEAVREVEGDQDSMVVEELQSGFELNGKVIRPATVVISKKK
jgi:molecular chaperone GrpE